MRGGSYKLLLAYYVCVIGRWLVVESAVMMCSMLTLILALDYQVLSDLYLDHIWFIPGLDRVSNVSVPWTTNWVRSRLAQVTASRSTIS